MESECERQTTLDTLTAFFHSIDMPVSAPLSQSKKIIKQHAVTKDKRQKILDRFFSAVLAQVRQLFSGTHVARYAPIAAFMLFYFSAK